MWNVWLSRFLFSRTFDHKNEAFLPENEGRSSQRGSVCVKINRSPGPEPWKLDFLLSVMDFLLPADAFFMVRFCFLWKITGDGEDITWQNHLSGFSLIFLCVFIYVHKISDALFEVKHFPAFWLVDSTLALFPPVALASRVLAAIRRRHNNLNIYLIGAKLINLNSASVEPLGSLWRLFSITCGKEKVLRL